MIEIDINPLLVTIGSFKVGWGLVMGIVAGIVAIPVFAIIARNSGIRNVHIVWLSLLTIICGYSGAILFGILESFIAYHNINTINFGVRADGFPIAVFIAVLIYTRVVRLSFWQVWDIGMPCLILYLAVYRIGCVLVGCCYGLPCDQTWALIYNHPNSPAPHGMSIYPTQFYHLAVNVIILIILWFIRKSFKVTGALGLVAWMLYFAGDFPIRFFRGNEPPVLGLSLTQITDLVAVATGAYFLVSRLKNAIREGGIDS